jgi:hypothetical protein
MLGCLLLLLCASILDVQDPRPERVVIHGPMVSIIMDDLGYNLDTGKRTLALGQNITLSILPKRPHSTELAQLAARTGHEVMVHLPMQSTHSLHRLGFGGLTLEMDEQEFIAQAEDALRAVPHARGVNNHMGSLLTQNRTQMEWLMLVLRERYRHFYFIDSKTTEQSLAGEIARNHRVPSMGRDVFLDSIQTAKHVQHQLKRLIGVARRRGYALAIAHPHESTLQVLENELPRLQREGIAFVRVSTLIEYTGSKQWFAHLSR